MAVAIIYCFFLQAWISAGASGSGPHLHLQLQQIFNTQNLPSLAIIHNNSNRDFSLNLHSAIVRPMLLSFRYACLHRTYKFSIFHEAFASNSKPRTTRNPGLTHSLLYFYQESQDLFLSLELSWDVPKSRQTSGKYSQRFGHSISVTVRCEITSRTHILLCASLEHNIAILTPPCRGHRELYSTKSQSPVLQTKVCLAAGSAFFFFLPLNIPQLTQYNRTTIP